MGTSFTAWLSKPVRERKKCGGIEKEKEWKILQRWKRKEKEIEGNIKIEKRRTTREEGKR